MILLKHEVMVVDEWQDNGPQDLVTVSLCVQIDIDKNVNVFIVHSLCLPIPYPPSHHGALCS